MATLLTFLDPAEAGRWRAVNDGVMGGVSAGGFRVVDESGVFAGELSLDHGGGFASVRRAIGVGSLAGTAGLWLRVRGDGRYYQCRLGSADLGEGMSYAAGFETAAGEWREIALRWSAFEAVFRGRLVPDAPPLVPGRIDRVGFLLADRRPGPFRLEIAAIRTL